MATVKKVMGGEKQSRKDHLKHKQMGKLNRQSQHHHICFKNRTPTPFQSASLHCTIVEEMEKQDGLAGWSHILGKLARLAMPQALFLFRAMRIYPLFPQFSPQLFLIIQCLLPFWIPYPTAKTAWFRLSLLQLSS